MLMTIARPRPVPFSLVVVNGFEHPVFYFRRYTRARVLHREDCLPSAWIGFKHDAYRPAVLRSLQSVCEQIPEGLFQASGVALHFHPPFEDRF